MLLMHTVFPRTRDSRCCTSRAPQQEHRTAEGRCTPWQAKLYSLCHVPCRVLVHSSCHVTLASPPAAGFAGMLVVLAPGHACRPGTWACLLSWHLGMLVVLAPGACWSVLAPGHSSSWHLGMLVVLAPGDAFRPGTWACLSSWHLGMLVVLAPGHACRPGTCGCLAHPGMHDHASFNQPCSTTIPQCHRS